MSTNWDDRFIDLAVHASTWSKDPSTQVGCVVVRQDKTVASMGFNGFPRGLDDDPDLYADRERKLSRTIHAEVNAILNAHEPIRGMHVYVTHPPCTACALQLIQAGAKSVSYVRPSEDLMSRWKDSIDNANALFEEAGVEVCESA